MFEENEACDFTPPPQDDSLVDGSRLLPIPTVHLAI